MLKINQFLKVEPWYGGIWISLVEVSRRDRLVIKAEKFVYPETLESGGNLIQELDIVMTLLQKKASATKNEGSTPQ